LPDQRSGTIVTDRLVEQFAPNKSSLSWFALYIAARSTWPIVLHRPPMLSAVPGSKPCRSR
jgi:hypothetical protein